MLGVIIPPNVERPTRRAHVKSSSGCKECKRRKVKCDEKKPVCGQCIRRFVAIESCEYALPEDVDPRTRTLAARVTQYRSQSSTASQLHEWDWTNVLCRPPRAEMLDPFETHPQSRVMGVDCLIKYYLQEAVYTCFPWQPRSETNPTTAFFVPLVWSDVVLFHTILQLSALRMGRHEKGIGINIGHLAAETIRLLRERIEVSNNESGVSDSTISAVATLAGIEHEKSNMKMLRMHMNGLERMINIRGGLNAIRESNPMVANSVFWMFVVAIYELPFPKLDPVLTPFPLRDHGLFVPPTVTSHFQDIELAHEEPPPLDFSIMDLLQPIATILNSVQHVSQLVPVHSAYPTASTSLVILTRMCTILSHLLSLPPIKPSPISDCGEGISQFSALISESTRIAIILHVFTPWRGLPPDGTLTINHLLHQLIASLKALQACSEYKNSILILWIFSVGGVAAFGMPERAWFIAHLADMTAEMEIERWEAMKACLSRCIWHEKLVGRSHAMVWREIERRKTEQT